MRSAAKAFIISFHRPAGGLRSRASEPRCTSQRGARGPDAVGEASAMRRKADGRFSTVEALPASRSGRLVVAIRAFRLLQRWVRIEVIVSSTQSKRGALPDRRAAVLRRRARRDRPLCQMSLRTDRSRIECCSAGFDSPRTGTQSLFGRSGARRRRRDEFCRCRVHR